MEFQKVIDKRKMIRSFKRKPIEEASLQRIIKNLFKGPSAGFSQGTEILVLVEEGDKELFFAQWGSKEERQKTKGNWKDMENADVIILVCSNKQAYLDRYAEKDKGWIDRDEKRWVAPYWDIDAGMASLIALLTVVDEGLGAVFTGYKDLAYLRDVFDIPLNFSPIGAILIGVPKENDVQSDSLNRGRKSLENIVHTSRW